MIFAGAGVRSSTRNAVEAAAAIGCTVADLLDRDIQQFDTIWAAGGMPNAVFRLTPAELARLTGATFSDVAWV